MAKGKKNNRRKERDRISQSGKLSVVASWWEKCMRLEKAGNHKLQPKKLRKEAMKKSNVTKSKTTSDDSITVEEEPQTVSSTSVTPVSAERSTESPIIEPHESPKNVNGRSVLLPPFNGAEIDVLSTATHQLFNSLCYSEETLSALPNRTWAIHCTETPIKRIVVSSTTMHDSQESGLIPLYTKQIIFDEKLHFEILLVNSRLVLKDKPMSISSMHDFEDLLEYVDSLKICAGGPPISQYNKVHPECAYRDAMNNWRHNLCSLEIRQDEEACESCNSLEEILRRHAQRMVKWSGKRKR